MAIIESAVGGKHQHIYGCVERDGSLVSGEGFRCHKIQEGTYMVEFEQPFAKPPAPICTVFGPPWLTFNLSAAIVDVDPYRFVCITSSPDRPMDAGFTFIAFGDI